MYYNIRTLLAIAGSVSAATLSIHVGENGSLLFNPNSITAAVGDTLEFHFYSGSGGHSVVSSAFSTPCAPATDAFFSGYIPGNDSGDTTFVTTVQSTDPIWFYCSLGDHCQSGMVGVVNPPSGQTITDYINAAEDATKGTVPAALQGGVLTTISPSSAAGSTSSAASSIATSSASPVESSTSSSVLTTSVSSSTSESQSATVASSASASGSSSPTSTTAESTTSSSNVGATSTSASAGVSPATSTTSAGMGIKGDMGAIMGLAIAAGGLVALMA